MSPPETPKKTTTMGAYTNFFKSLFGSGVLALPHALDTVGLKLGVSSFLLIALSCTFSCYILLRAKRRAILACPTLKFHTYGDLAGSVMDSSTFGHVVSLLICVLELCFCSGMIIMIYENVTSAMGLTRLQILPVLLPILILLGQIKWLSELVIFSFIAALIYLFGVMGSSFVYSILNFNPPSDVFDMKYSGLIQYIGTATYTLEGICLVLPCERSMADPTKATNVACYSLLSYSFLTATFAAVAYASGLGQDGCNSVTECFSGHGYADVVKILLSVALVLSHPITLYPATEIFEAKLIALLPSSIGCVDTIHEDTPLLDDVDIRDTYSSSSDEETGSEGTETNENVGSSVRSTSRVTSAGMESSKQSFKYPRALRCFLVLLTVAVGTLTTSFQTFSNLVGGVGLSFVGFILPVLLDWRATKLMREAGLVDEEPTNIPEILDRVFSVALLTVGAINIAVTTSTVL